ncbi:TPR and ankyrin repeat-containing protein 1 isoform X2 [Xenopus laevis]|uniref:TPR and ankyrin repeat-containing protein 1 isoform X2 n=1 Tax=Xenopus laevis TaxID=8355 RepID=A0A8J1KXM2_XENLA|nr:TPR and ankyrin repeat-containing protein 1 isoform X2 [Xenopus laevis]XP_041422057.1 TPR and ankyrin repeat-containing protein 1 isoform X2 [Xenopus laevis]
MNFRGGQFINFQRELSVLWYNRANALFKLEKWQEALMSANQSITLDHRYVKAYYRSGCCFLKLFDTRSALMMFSDGLSMLSGTSEIESIADFLNGVFQTFEESDFDPMFLRIFDRILKEKYSKQIWKMLIERLVNKKMFKSCLFLMECRDKLPKDICDLRMSLKGIFETYANSTWCRNTKSITDLVQWLTTMGANVESTNYPLHAIINLCIKSDNCNLFNQILRNKPSLREKINQKDKDGRTLLHIVAFSCTSTSGYTMKRQANDIKMLLDYGSDPSIPDQQQMYVSDILKRSKNFKAESIIKKHLENLSCHPSQTKDIEATLSEKQKLPPQEEMSLSLENAVEQFMYFCKQESVPAPNLLKHKKVKSFLHILSTVKDIPPGLVCDIPESVVQDLITQLLMQQRWQEVLLLLTGAVDGTPAGESKGLLKRCPLPDINIGHVVHHLSRKSEVRLPLVKLLLDQGVSPDGVGALCEPPMCTCLKNNDFALAYLLLKAGVTPQNISLNQGDTPLHAAAYIALCRKDDYGIMIMKHLLDLYSSEPLEYSYLNPNIQDSNGDTIMHMVFQSLYQKQYRAVIELLSKFDIKLTIKNKLGKDARHRIKDKDAHYIAWNEASKKNKQDLPCTSLKPKKTSSNGNKPQTKLQTKSSPPLAAIENSDISSAETDINVDKQVLVNPPVLNMVNTIKPMTAKDILSQAIQDLIKGMDFTRAPTESRILTSTVSSTTKDNLISLCSNDTQSQSEDFCEDEQAVNYVTEFDDNEHESNLLEDDLDISKTDFGNMTWEIECAPEALKKLGSKAVPQYMKNKIILSIQKLGNGEWTRSLHKQLKYLKCDIKLFEVKLDKGARMLWELAIDFSPRCSEKPETIMGDESSSNASNKTGRVYTEIIRIWDIVLDHCKLSSAIDVICHAYNRGLTCILRKKLKGITKSHLFSNVEKRVPLCFVEDIELETNMIHVIPNYFPPASAAETEYSIMKFHSFSTDMALNILNNISTRVEYPFRVGELEYAVIDLNPKPMEAIILIGRSGTGKTTCCLYRLWKKFHSYWEKAELIGGPWLVKQTWQRRNFDENVENGDTEDEDTTDTEEMDSTEEEQISLEQDSLNTDETLSEYEDEKDPCKLEHFHPIFITKNHVLCQEVQRNFCELSKSTKATNHFRPAESNIYRLQDLKDEHFPLFVTSQQLLLLLDASMSDPFFPRNEDGSLKRSIIGWSSSDEIDIPDLMRDYDEDDGELDNEKEETVCELKERDPRVFVTFELFAGELWPQMVKGKTTYNAALVWKEIKSFLKGSFEALSCHQGKLTEDEYYKLGKKRAPNFQEDRKEIYHLFSMYEQIKSKKGYFDEEDVLYHLSCQLSKLEDLPWSIHELYGDEIQDFTQAELSLLMRCINDPNSMFLTGDTAQSIMKGVSFRFSDLRSLFYYANKNAKSDRKKCFVRKPKRIYQLYQNYRSHSGILHLASGVVDLLQYFFPESFDRLPRDCGLFDGPKPTVLESCSVSDLAILLRGNKRKAQPIEFGAHQVILVKNESAKEKIPEELSLALVLTIYEAKGLEFDDVLLYNFFTDSEASKEWRIISSFMPESHSDVESKPLIEISMDKVCMPVSRQLKMNPELHKMLNGELKQLYTAVTRARVNLWIFDESQEKRAPAFGFFIKGNFVEVVRTDENKDLDDNMFVRTSTKDEWISRGDYYASHKCWKVAAKCYQKGEATDKEKLAFAHDAVLHLQTKKASAREKQMEFLRLAKTYMECREPKLAVKCLAFAKEFHLCGELCRKLGKNKDAAYFFKKIQNNVIAAQCFEAAGELEMALNLYRQEKMYEAAVLMLEKHKKNPNLHVPFTAKHFYLEAAANLFTNNKIKKMNEILANLDVEDQLVFLKKHKRWSEAASLLKKHGRCEEAAFLMRDHGKLLEAADLTMNKEFRALCLLAAARCQINDCDVSNEIGDTIAEAMQIFKEIHNGIGVAEATLLEGIMTKDFGKLHSSFQSFVRQFHCAGAVEALCECIKCDEFNQKLLFLAASGLQHLITLLKALKAPKTNADRENVKSCLEFFGVVQKEEDTCKILQHEGSRIFQIFTEENFDIKDRNIELNIIKSLLERHFLKRLCNISAKVLGNVYPESDICPKFIAGLDCTDENCQDFHRPVLQHEFKRMLLSKRNLTTISGLLLDARHLSKEFASELQEILGADVFRFPRSLLNLLFPKHFHLRILSENKGVCKIFEEIRRNFPKPCINMLTEYGKSLFKEKDDSERRASTDLWLKAMCIFSLSSCYPDELKCLLDEVEVKFNRDYMPQSKYRHEAKEDGRRLKGLDVKYGMLKPDVSSGSLKDRHIHFFRLFQSSVDQLYILKNPESSKTHFFRFLNYIVKKSICPLIPNIGNSVMLLEFQFIFCCVVLMRLSPSIRVLLPKSYISVLHHWESMFGRKGKSVVKDTYSILMEYKPRNEKQAIGNFKYHLTYLAKVLCGAEEHNFNVLLDAFRDIDCIYSGEAERTLVLYLVMMVNVKGVMNSQTDIILKNNFPFIQQELKNQKEMFPSKVPERLLNTVNNLPDNAEEIVNFLQNLLSQRDEERLVDCCWRWDGAFFKGSVRGIFYDDKFKFKEFANVQHIKQDFESPYFEDGQEYFPEEKVDIVATLVSQVQQKHSAMQQFHELLIFVCFCIKWKRASLHAKKRRMEESTPDSFKIAGIDTTQCDLCGVKFSLSPTLFSAPTEEYEEETVSPTTNEIENSGYLESLVVPNISMTYENHINLETHCHQMQAYNNYLQFYKLKVNAVLSEAKSLVQSMKQMTDDQLATELNLEQTKIKNKMKDIVDRMEDIYERKKWSEAEMLMESPLQALESTLSEAQSVLNKAEQHMANQEGLQKKDLFDHEIDYDFEELWSKKTKKAKKKGKRH